jgi:hypothetical protein
MELPVLLEGWQWQCCGEPFRIGSLVRWTLWFSQDLVGLPQPAIVTWTAQGQTIEPGIVVLTDGQVQALPSRELGQGAQELQGAFYEDHHELASYGPVTVGRVDRIRLIASARPDQRPGDLRDVDRLPPSTHGGFRWEDVLVNLTVLQD